MSVCVKHLVLLFKCCSVYMKYNLKLELWPEFHPEHWLWAGPDDNHPLSEATHHHLLLPIKIVLLFALIVAAGIWSRLLLIGVDEPSASQMVPQTGLPGLYFCLTGTWWTRTASVFGLMLLVLLLNRFRSQPSSGCYCSMLSLVYVACF